ncbi:MAG TPA: ROK family protein [Terriglobales bacterium]|jgi:glucokinase
MTQVLSANDYIMGVDIGGTKVAAGLVDSAGTIESPLRVPMISNADAAAGLESVLSAIDSVMAKVKNRQEVRAIGICAPGPLDPKTGLIINPPNLPCWRNFPLAKEIAGVYSVPVKVDNDANSAAFAEARWGAGRNYKNIFYVTIGTGIGTGIILDGRIYHGRTGAAGEGGHVSIDYRGPRCSCGKLGCIEILASGPAIAKRARAKLSSDASRSSVLLQLAKGNPESVTTEMVGKADAAGDPVASETLRETIDLLSLWLGNMVDVLDPEAIIIGGGATTVLLPFFDQISELLPKYCVNPRANEIAVLPAHYGADSGVAGGAALCYEIPSPVSR